MGKAVVTQDSATREACAALEECVQRHTVRDGAMCRECGHLWPCFTHRALTCAVRMLAVAE